MPTSQRINLVLDGAIYRRIRLLAENEGVSLPVKARDLIKEALEIQEDAYLSRVAEEREASWDESTALSHEDVCSSQYIQ